MKARLRFLKDESGQAMVLFALVFVVLCGFAALVVDNGTLFVNKDGLQSAADSAALAGAQDLPNAATAENTAIEFAELNGLDPSEITVTSPYNGDSNKIEVVCTKTVENSFAKVLGFSSTTVTARAVAEKTGTAAGAFNYAVFSGSTSTTLTFNGSHLDITGSAHTNCRFVVNGSSQTITGSAEAVSSFTANGSNLTIGGTCQAESITVSGSNINIARRVYSAAAIIEMPDFSDSIEEEAIRAGQYYTGHKTYNGSNISVDSPIFVDGNITVNGSRFTGNGIILASGYIIFNGSNLKNSASDAVCFYSENGDITINGSNIELDGVIYAPNGTITMNGSHQTIRGRVIAKSIVFNGSHIEITSGSGDLACLPTSSIKLVG